MFQQTKSPQNLLLHESKHLKLIQMKTVLAILLVIGTFNNSWAQNYQLIYPHQEKHFNYRDNSNVSNDTIIQSIRIDSTASLGNNLHYYNHQILSQTSYTGSCQMTIHDSSWIGHQIIAKPNGDYLFFNKDTDSICIKTAANLNDSWVLYRFPNNDYIEASLISINNSNLLGSTDSVKTIVLQAKDNSNNIINHPFNNKEIKFSKNYGLVDFYSMTNFPLDTNKCTLVGSSSPNMGIVNLTTAEIFDYNIGDEFHIDDYFRSHFNPWEYDITYIRRIVLNKVISSNQDTLTYTIARCQNRYVNFSITPDPDTIISLDTLTEVIILSQHTRFNQLSNEIRSDSASYSTFLIHSQFNKRTKRIDNQYYRTGMHCWSEQVGFFAPFHSYIEGLGGPYYDNPYTSIGTDYYKLAYYNKGGTTWGTPLNIDCTLGTSVAQIANEENNIAVYPNPVANYTTITIQNFLPSEDWNFKLYDATGRIVRLKKIQNGSFRLKRTNLVGGIYFYQIKNNSLAKIYTGKIIVE
jgi:hypothetical protein